jgi:hypothetical protein
MSEERPNPVVSQSTRRVYSYVGPADIARRAAAGPAGTIISAPADACRWLAHTGQETTGLVIATFVVDVDGRLRLADRHSEHVACAAGQPVLAAGEITFQVQSDDVLVEMVSNQSTGYCPEPESWPAVAQALARAGLSAPAGYEPALFFRRCPRCATVNVVKDNILVCDVCGGDLPVRWNLASLVRGS